MGRPIPDSSIYDRFIGVYSTMMNFFHILDALNDLITRLRKTML